MDMIETKDSCLLLAGDLGSSCEGPPYELNPGLIKVSLQGEMIWEKKFSTPYNAGTMYSLCDSETGAFYAIGCIFSDTTYLALYKLTENADIIWKRKILLENQWISASFYAMPYQMVEIEDGLVICGMARYPGYPKPFLIRTDLDGCDGLYSCQDTAMLMNLYSWEDSVCNGDSVLVSVAIENGNGPFTGIINQVDTINEELFIMFDTSSFIFYAHPTLTNPQVEVSIIDPNAQVFNQTKYFNVVDCNIQINKIETETKLRISPNPANEIIRLDVSQYHKKNSTLQIFNQDGKLIEQIRLVDHQMNLDISHLHCGIYFIKLINNTVIEITKLVVIR